MIQYQMCVQLGYSLREYRCMEPGEINEQMEAHISINEKKTDNTEDPYTAGVSF